MGFALENFDPIGRWRTTYEKNLKIDASGQLPGGTAYRDIVSFRQVLLGQQELFIRALTGKLLAYAWGRQLEASDRPTIDAITGKLAAQGNGFRDLIKLVAAACRK